MRKTKPTITATLQLSSADTIPHSPTLWAIPDRLPRHHLSAIVAPTGTGLTTLATNLCAYLAPIANRDSHIENGLPAVLYIPGRESIYSTRERLIAAGADLSQILILNEVEVTTSNDQRRDTTTRHPNASDPGRIASVLREHKSIRLVLIDNAEDLFIASNRPSRNKLLRELAAFQSLAESREVAVTFLTAIPTLNRDPFRSRFLSALYDICRTIHLLAPEPDAERDGSPIENQNSKIKNALLFSLKNTLSSPGPTLRLDLARPYADQDTTIPDMLYPDYLRLLNQPKKTGPAPDSRNYAIEVLRALLKPGQRLPVGQHDDPAKGTIHYLIREAGLSFATVLRAKEQLGFVATRGRKCWYWSHPAAEISTSTPAQDQRSAPPITTCNSSQKSAASQPPDPPRHSPTGPAATPQLQLPEASHPAMPADIVFPALTASTGIQKSSDPVHPVHACSSSRSLCSLCPPAKRVAIPVAGLRDFHWMPAA